MSTYVKNPAILFLLIVLAGLYSFPASAQDSSAQDSSARENSEQDNSSNQNMGILTPPAVEDGILYFVHWPEILYAFDESENKLRWSAPLDPVPPEIDPEALPAPSPTPQMSYIFVHLGRRLWGISKIDGHSVWHVDGLPEASRRSSDTLTNTLPGYYLIENDTMGAVLTLEMDGEFWFCRGRRPGDGNQIWERRINGEPRGWWLDGEALWVAYELFGAEGPGSAEDNPAVIMKLESGTGDLIWATPVPNDAAFRSAFRIPRSRVYLSEEHGDGEFEVRGFNENTGELYRSISWSGGEFIAALASSDKLVFLNSEGSGNIKFQLYHSSLNPIQYHTIHKSRNDQLFPSPVIDGNLFLYAGCSFSLHDGNMVWQEQIDGSMIDWAADDYRIYFWDSAGSLIGLDRLTGKEIWRTPFNVLPHDGQTGPNHGVSSLTLTDNRLFATTPSGELIRIDPENGRPFPGVLQVTLDSGIERTGNGGGQMTTGGRNSAWLWITISIVVLIGAFFLWFGMKKTNSWGGTNGNRGL